MNILIFIQFYLDIDLLLPLFMAARERPDLNPIVYLSDKEGPSTEGSRDVLTSLGINYQIVKDELIVSGKQPQFSERHVLVTASESTARPHRAAHVMTKRANEAGLRTYTLQHGFENIGLTYFDQVHTVENIRFESQQILIWGPLEKLHRDIPEETKLKCVSVGCCKDIAGDPTGLLKPGDRKFLVAVFENLHWHRYDDRYRKLFLSDLTEMARKYGDTTFLVKPHPAGRWLTHRHKGQLPSGDNILLAYPHDPEWRSYTSQAIIGLADGVITTPSTVAVDAARANRPVAIVGYGLELENYNPLPILRSRDNWESFVDRVRTPERCEEFKFLTSSFTRNNLVPGDACRRILDQFSRDLPMIPRS